MTSIAPPALGALRPAAGRPSGSSAGAGRNGGAGGEGRVVRVTAPGGRGGDVGRTTWGRAAAAAGLAAVAALPAAAHGDEPPPLRTEQTWFSCGEEAAGAAGNAARATWGVQRPATRTADGGGCATADSANVGVRGQAVAASFGADGVFRGRLESVTLALDAVDPLAGQVRQDVEVSLSVDGGPARVARVLVPADPTSTGRARYRLTLTGLGLDEDREHVLALSVDAEADGLRGATWVAGASDADGGLVFNPTEPAGTVAALP